MKAIKHIKTQILHKTIIILVIIALMISYVGYYFLNQEIFSYANIINLPLDKSLPLIKPNITQKPFHLPVMRGIEIDPKSPLNIKFYFDKMNKSNVSKKDITRMIRYFFGFLSISEDKLWVNLSPYEKNRIIPESLSRLDIGKDMLLEDYLLKQLVSRLTDPNSVSGKKYWDQIQRICFNITKTKNIPINIFHKVWIVPDQNVIYKHKHTIFIKEARLKVMMDEDYLAIKKQRSTKGNENKKQSIIRQIQLKINDVFKRDILHLIEKQINNSIYFLPLRQLYYSLVLANYFKSELKDQSVYRRYINRE